MLVGKGAEGNHLCGSGGKKGRLCVRVWLAEVRERGRDDRRWKGPATQMTARDGERSVLPHLLLVLLASSDSLGEGGLLPATLRSANWGQTRWDCIRGR